MFEFGLLEEGVKATSPAQLQNLILAHFSSSARVSEDFRTFPKQSSWKVFPFIIIYRVMMYTNPLLIVQAIYFTSKGQYVYYSTRGVIQNLPIYTLVFRKCTAYLIFVLYE